MAAFLLYVTASSREEALRLGRALVEERLAACVNVLDGMTSIYHWQGKVEEGSEAVLILKTREELVAKATDRLRDLHSYDCPCVLALPVSQGNPGFLAWIESETATSLP
ncbi:divalent-cation tolerance protein CutA [Telmatospirillum sp. J64-1]|uniref:divalent-cation tolerance protein CutA n=1 Tax=Telmatospirillum sp. J64-1 TaxID=2502183 RepID=UPI00115DA10A|nr:divalent-cation tolerance protein CutA [Telmatospirillum sp. J64-1]